MFAYEKLLAYWQSAATTLQHFYPKQKHNIEISNAECVNGAIPLATANKIFAYIKTLAKQTQEPDAQSANHAVEQQDTTKVIISPAFIHKECLENSNEQSIFYVLCLYAEITVTGQILPCKYQPLPWIPRILTEPTTIAPFSMGSSEQFDHYYHFSPPPWGKEGPNCWQEQLTYGQDFLENISKGAWKWQIYQLGYTLSEQVAIIPIVPLVTANKNTLSFATIAKKEEVWKKLFTFAETEERYKTAIDNNDNKLNAHFAHINNKYSLSEQQRKVLMQALRLAENKTFYVMTGPGTGKTTVIHDLVASLWTKAIIEDTVPPTIGIIKNDKKIYRTTILDCLPDGSSWLTSQQKWLFYQLEPSATSQSKSKIIENFMLQCSKEFNKDITNLEEGKQLLYERIMLLQTALMQGLEAAFAYEELIKKIASSYSSHGGIEERNKIIRAAAEKQNSYYHYLEILQSLWHRHITPTSSWHKWLEYLPPFKQRKIQRLRAFFAKHLPEENTEGLSILQMQEHLANLLLRAKKKQHALADILVQIEADIQQLNFAKARVQRWVPEQIEDQFELAKLINFLDTHLRYRLFLTTVHYWETELLQTAGWDHADIFNDYYSEQQFAIGNLIQQPVDWLIVEHGEHLSPVDGFYCVEGSKRLIVMGDLESVKPNRLPMEIDINLLKTHELIAVEEDIEELQLKEILIANGRFNILIEQIADYTNKEEYCLNKQWDAAYKIIACHNQLSYAYKLQSCRDIKHTFIENFAYLPIKGYREPYLGSFRNDIEITAIINWIKQHQASILACYPECSFANTIIVCTTFYGQCVAFKEAFAQYNIEISNIELIQLPSSKRVPIVIFSPVYTKEDKGKLNFEQGRELLRSLLLRAKDHLIVFGDHQIFDQNLHSASGKFADFLLASKKNKLIESVVD